MAIYPYRCEVCGHEQEVVQTIASYSKAPNRPQCCEKEMARVFTAPMITPDYQPFVSSIDGTVINSRSSHREHMQRHGVVVYDDVVSEIKSAQSRKAVDAVQSLKSDIVEAVTKVDQGYKPHIEKAQVTAPEQIDVMAEV